MNSQDMGLLRNLLWLGCVGLCKLVICMGLQWVNDWLVIVAVNSVIRFLSQIRNVYSDTAVVVLQGGSARGNYYQQGLSLPSPSSAAAAAALAGAISPGTGFMPLALGGRPYNQHQMVCNSAGCLSFPLRVTGSCFFSLEWFLSPVRSLSLIS